MVQRLNEVKGSLHPKLIYIFNIIPFKIFKDLFSEIKYLILKLLWNRKRIPRIAKSILKIKIRFGGLTLTKFKA